VLFIGTLLGGLPVAFALLVASAAYLALTGIAPMVELPHNMVAGTSNFVLLALPFFIVAGLIMERGGISLRLVRFVHALVGHLRGGLLQVMVVSMYIVSGLSGSKSADVAAVGSVMRDMLVREGYTTGECAAALAASAAMGETVPPSISILILGSITSLSMAALFIGGVVPAAVIAVCLMLLIYARAQYLGTPQAPRAGLKTLWRTGADAFLSLLMPVILFGGILLGLATPTEVSAIAIVYGLLLAIVAYRALDARTLLSILNDAAILSGMVLFILAAAQCFSWVLTNAYVPQHLVEALHGLHDNRWLFLVASIVVLIVAGSLLEGLPALNVLAPLLIPIAGQIGISRLHYGIVLVIAMGIGAFLPPTGVGFYVCCAVSRATIEDGTRAMLPYLVVLLAGLLIVAFVPWFTLFLPAAAGFGG
jgi:tripartite ATP-independent transporter DctM subunit